MSSLRCGRIAYTNDLPIYAALDERAIAFPGVLVEDVPTRLNSLLCAGKLDMGPMSAAHYARHPDDFVLLDDLCIGARDAVWSVVLVSPSPPALLHETEIAVSRESASGRGLLKVLLERRYGVRARFAPHDDPFSAAMMRQPTLLIGDVALDAREKLDPSTVYDLGRLWHDWTDADSVFAVWVARRDVALARPADVEAAMSALVASFAWYKAHRSRVCAIAQSRRPRPIGFYEDYYATLNFSLDLGARAGLARFIAELDAVGLLPGVLPVNREIAHVGS